MKKLPFALMSVVVAALLAAAPAAGTSTVESAIVEPLDARTFVVVSRGGKVISLYRVVDGKIELLDVAVLTDYPSRVPAETFTLKHQEVRK